MNKVNLTKPNAPFLYPPCGFVMFQRVEKGRIGSKWVNFELVLLVFLVFVYLSVYRYLTVLQVEVPTFFFEFVI